MEMEARQCIRTGSRRLMEAAALEVEMSPGMGQLKGVHITIVPQWEASLHLQAILLHLQEEAWVVRTNHQPIHPRHPAITRIWHQFSTPQIRTHTGVPPRINQPTRCQTFRVQVKVLWPDKRKELVQLMAVKFTDKVELTLHLPRTVVHPTMPHNLSRPAMCTIQNKQLLRQRTVDQQLTSQSKKKWETQTLQTLKSEQKLVNYSQTNG